jgi:hypothetical protein
MAYASAADMPPAAKTAIRTAAVRKPTATGGTGYGFIAILRGFDRAEVVGESIRKRGERPIVPDEERARV